MKHPVSGSQFQIVERYLLETPMLGDGCLDVKTVFWSRGGNQRLAMFIPVINWLVTGHGGPWGRRKCGWLLCHFQSTISSPFGATHRKLLITIFTVCKSDDRKDFVIRALQQYTHQVIEHHLPTLSERSMLMRKYPDGIASQTGAISRH